MTDKQSSGQVITLAYYIADELTFKSLEAWFSSYMISINISLLLNLTFLLSYAQYLIVESRDVLMNRDVSCTFGADYAFGRLILCVGETGLRLDYIHYNLSHSLRHLFIYFTSIALNRLAFWQIRSCVCTQHYFFTQTHCQRLWYIESLEGSYKLIPEFSITSFGANVAS